MSKFYPYAYNGKPAKLEYPWTFPMPSEKERDRRWNALRQSMNKHNFDCLIVSAPYGYMSTPYNYLYYISNYVPFINHGLSIVFPVEGEPQLEMSDDIGPQLLYTALQTSWINEVLASSDPAKDIVSKINRLKLENGRLGIIGYKREVFPASLYDALRECLPGAVFGDAMVALHEAMNEVSRSSEEEFTLLKKSCAILDSSYNAVAEAFKPGVAEYELWAAAEQAIIKNGGWYPHFMLATSGPNLSFQKAPPSHNTLTKGDAVVFEINVIYGGISAQICYALSLGRPNSEVGKMFELCQELYNFSLAELEKKKTFRDIELDLHNRIHGAGYEPMMSQIHNYNQSYAMPLDSPPQSGDYFIVHPNMGKKDYTACAKCGDTVRILKDGRVERLQKTPAKLNII